MSSQLSSVGLPATHVKLQSLSQPSLLVTLPSSQASPLSTTPLPHIDPLEVLPPPPIAPEPVLALPVLSVGVESSLHATALASATEVRIHESRRDDARMRSIIETDRHCVSPDGLTAVTRALRSDFGPSAVVLGVE